MTSLEDIGYFRVTNRAFTEAAAPLKITDEIIKALPKQAVVVEVGSGLTQEFARKLKAQREDITCISIDPTLGITTDNFFTTHVKDDQNKLEQVSYINFHQQQRPQENWVDSKEKQEEIQRERLSEAQKTGSVVATLAPELPFANASVDLIVDSWGPGLYLDRYSQQSQLAVYLQELSRVLKANGQARIYPIDFYDETLRQSSEARNEKARQEYAQLLDLDSSLAYQFYDYEDPALVSKENTSRLGVIITKLAAEV